MELQEDREFTIKMSFDETLARHMASNVEISGQGLPDIPIGLGTMSCLILLAERESETEMSPEDSPDRYTRETFIDGLEELGLTVDETVQGDIDGMVRNGFIDIMPDGGFQAKPLAMDLAKQVDEAFPGMPGINLVAYLVQTIDEVLSGRKELKHAISQFDQTLGLYGHKKPGRGQDGSGTASASAAVSTDTIKSALSASLRRRKATQQKSEVFSENPKVVTASGEVLSVDIKDFSTKKETLPPMEESPSDEGVEEESAFDDRKQDLNLAAASYEEDVSENDGAGYLEPEESQEEEETIESAEGIPADVKMTTDDSVVQEAATFQGEDPQQAEGEETGPAALEETVPLSEEALQEQIEAFEQQLTMSCPVCTTGRIQDQQTGKGKVFYNCTNRDCFFVSWGKPYHQECPRCKNPFLIEATGKEGNTFLKCPRATCRHQEPIAGESLDSLKDSYGSTQPRKRVRRVVSAAPGSDRKKKRVVRRRVVRKKR